MTRLSMSEAFAKYGATQKNVNWSVSAWAPGGSLVVNLWAHHYRKGPSGSVEYASRLSDRGWRGPGKTEFLANVRSAFDEKRPVRLIVVTSSDPARVEQGENVSELEKTFDAKTEQVGEVAFFDGDSYVFRFRKA